MISLSARSKHEAYVDTPSSLFDVNNVEQLLEGRFRAEEIVAVIYQRYYNNFRKQGSCDSDFLHNINGMFICFVTTAIRHYLKALKTVQLAELATEF